MSALETGLSRYLDDSVRDRLSRAIVGIAGAGGLGSNVANHLVRSGIRNLVVADFDRVEASNLNRQFYFEDQIGRFKVEALKENLLRINPALRFSGHVLRLENGNIREIYAGCHILVEAFDSASAKAMLVETFWKSDIRIVSASGIGGYGRPDAFSVTSPKPHIRIVGDGKTPSDARIPPMSPRVGIAAAMQADLVLEHLIGTCPE